ncbi:MAG: TIGR03618 family F420-dependent PPOX class oxidoreductase [Microthrixaceae bacterium]
MSRRNQIRMSDAEVAAFLDGRHTMNVASINHDGTIHLVAMWYAMLDGEPVFWTFGKSQKIRNLQRDPRITLLVEAGEEYGELIGVELVGTATVLTDHDDIMAIGEAVYARYFGEVTDEVRPFVEMTGAKRFGVRIKVDRVVSWDHKKLDGAY